MIFAVVILVLFVCYLLNRAYQQQKDREFEIDRLKWSFLLKEAKLNERDFIYSSFSADHEDVPDDEQLHRILHRKTGKYLLLKSGGRFFEYQDSVYEGPPFYPALGGVVLPGTPCQKLVEVDRQRAMAALEDATSEHRSNR